MKRLWILLLEINTMMSIDHWVILKQMIWHFRVEYATMPKELGIPWIEWSQQWWWIKHAVQWWCCMHAVTAKVWHAAPPPALLSAAQHGSHRQIWYSCKKNLINFAFYFKVRENIYSIQIYYTDFSRQLFVWQLASRQLK